MLEPYWSDDTVSLYVGDMREVLPALGVTADLVLADPPYGETSLKWDRWPDGWVKVAADVAKSLWCFGSMRMFLLHGQEFDDAGWKLSQDVVWQKQNGTGLSRDRFRRVHEFALHWYRGQWRGIYHETPRTKHYGPDEGRRMKGASKGSHLGEAGRRAWADDGTRLMKSIIPADNLHRKALHPTQKPIGLIRPLIEYACPPDGLVLVPFVGSGSELVAAQMLGRRAMSQAPLDLLSEVPDAS
jgi:site-specific DNA-methyltransferase (adenine-specific)